MFAVAGLRASRSPQLDPGVLDALTWRPLGLAGLSVSRVTTDAAFPYRICACDATGITRCVLSSPGIGRDAAWETLPLPPASHVTPDVNDPDVLYTSTLQRFDRRTAQATWTGPELAAQFRGQPREASLAFSTDGRTLFAGLASVWRTTTGGATWTAISPDFTTVEANDRTVVSVLGVSPIDARVMWAGTTSGALHLTRDAGATWTLATPPAWPSGARITGVEASRFDPQAAYLTATGTGMSAVLWRTRDHGMSWTALGQNIPAAAGVHAVREDALRRGLLFAATDASVFFSIDDGDTWQGLRSNLPTAPVTDLAIREADLVAATRGQGVWVLDDFSPLRQITPDVLRANAFLFRPAQTWRRRASADGREPAGSASFAYLIAPSVADAFTIDVIETATGDTIRRYSSAPGARQPGDALLGRGPGLQRVVWDLRYARPESDPEAPPGARVLPGTYQVRLTTSVQTIRQSVAVRMDPRMRTAATDLAAQRSLARAIDRQRGDVTTALASASLSGAARATLVDARDELRRFALAFDAVDARPAVALESAAQAALARAREAVEAAR